MKNFLNIISMISVLLGLFTVVVLLIWWFIPYKTIIFKDKVFPILTKNIHAGDVITYKSDYCKYFDAPSIVTRHIINGYDYTMPSTISNRPIGCHVIYVSFVLPKETPAGKNYRSQQFYQIQVNPIRTVTLEEDTEPFNVLEATDSGSLE